MENTILTILKNFKEFFEKEVDLLSGFRINRKDKYYRQLLTLFYSTLINLLFLKNYKDYDCGFKIFKKSLNEIIIKKDFTPYLLTSQIFIYFFIYNFKISQLSIEYLESEKDFLEDFL